MTTLGTMEDRIADELARSDLASQIRKSIVTAVNHYEREPWWFLEGRSNTFNTVAAQEFYTSSDAAFIANIQSVDAMTITISSNRYPLNRRQYREIEAASILATSYGQPQDYAYYARQIRLYPIPDAVYSVRVSFSENTTTLSATTDSSNWTTIGEELIRYRAKWDLLMNVIKNPEEATVMKNLEMEAYSQLRFESTENSSSGKIKAMRF